MKKLKKLDDYNIERGISSRNLISNKPQPNGLECPKCGEELYDTNPMMVLMTYPPKKDIICNKCGYIGHRIV